MINSQKILVIACLTFLITTISMGMLGQPLMGLYIGLYIDMAFIIVWVILKLFKKP